MVDLSVKTSFGEVSTRSFAGPLAARHGRSVS
jgi:hypothetical protein